jgi:hypothetical protein
MDERKENENENKKNPVPQKLECRFLTNIPCRVQWQLPTT